MAKADRDETVPTRTEGGGVGKRLVDWAPQIIIGVVVILFIAFNTREVKISYGVGDARLPLWLALGAVALLGGVAGWFIGRRRLKRSQDP